MKLIKANILFFMLLSVLGGQVSAEIAFDLHAQHFSKALDGNYEGARYELPKAFVSTNLKYIDGAYITKNENGYINVEVKNPIANWSISVDAFYRMANSYNKTRSIKVTSENGESIVVSFRYDAVTFDGKNVYNPGAHKRVTVTLTQNGNDIELVINGAKVGTATRENFGKLQYTDVQAIYERDGAHRYDYINGLTIGSK